MNKDEDHIDHRLTEQAKAAFDQSVDALDAGTLSRLNRGRQAALAETHRPHLLWQKWMPATGLAAAVLLAVVTFRGAGELDVISAPPSDFEILLGEESIEMLEELEFYSWLATQDLGSEGDFG